MKVVPSGQLEVLITEQVLIQLTVFLIVEKYEELRATSGSSHVCRIPRD